MLEHRRLTLTGPAQLDLATIWSWIATGSGRARADGVLGRLRDTCAILAENPLLGRERTELRPGVRSFAVTPHMIIYDPIERGVRILRVLHGARSLPRSMREASPMTEN